MDRKKITVRHVVPSDVPTLVELDHRVWKTKEQQADSYTFIERIKNCGDTCWAVFIGKAAIASLYIMGVTHKQVMKSNSWDQITDKGTARSSIPYSQEWFGIGLAATQNAKKADAVEKLMTEAAIEALRLGIRYVYLGSPIPGLRKWLKKNRDKGINEYVYAKKVDNLPLDPQLRYYYKEGFRKIVQIKQNYFPHEKSLDYGVILRLENPFWRMKIAFRLLPTFLLRLIIHFFMKYI